MKGRHSNESRPNMPMVDQRILLSAEKNLLERGMR